MKTNFCTLLYCLKERLYLEKNIGGKHIKNEMKLLLTQSTSTPYILVCPAHQLLREG